jgi:alpha-amylase/alpha-mannosidase (GH57 family)
MKTVRVCFFWHMHQPYYTDPVAGTTSMQWVRLHATEAYSDMAFLLERFPGVRATFNFTPSLLLQLQELASGSVHDLFWEHAQRPAADLSPAERAFIVRHFFAANWASMVRPYPRYHELLVKRGVDVKGQDLEHLARPFATQDLLDLQVWHNLAWFGYGAVAQYPRIAALRRKDRGFTEGEKQEVLAIQRAMIGEIIPRYRRLADAGEIELTTSPFYHPILPLLIDTDIARRSRPETALPQRFQAPADAEAQIQRAVSLHTELFGRPPTGMWPSEGSVCPEMIPMVRRAGLQWMASDEGVLARSLADWHRAADLYQPYQVGSSGDDIAMLFRDRDLSDAVGFVYSKSTPEAGVEDLVRRITDVARHAPGDDVVIPIILDGENPWEYYHDGGERFLSETYRALSGTARTAQSVRMVTDTISHALEARPAHTRLEHLHSGSWINQDFKIWLGHPEDNRGWDLLRETRSRLVEVAGSLAPEQAQGAWEELYAAEGSDWFWWYGDDFETDYKVEFDRLFRTHLRNVFIHAGIPAPEFLDDPVLGQGMVQESGSARKPVNLLSPAIDGRVSDFFEWRGAGSINPLPPLGAMWTSRKLFTQIAFGFSIDALFLRLDPCEELGNGAPDMTAELHVLTGSHTYKLTFPLTRHDVEAFTLYSAPAGSRFVEVGRYDTICRGTILELAVPFKVLGLQAGQEFRMSLVVMQNGLEAARYPGQAPLALTVPDANFEAAMWRV